MHFLPVVHAYVSVVVISTRSVKEGGIPNRIGSCGFCHGICSLLFLGQNFDELTLDFCLLHLVASGWLRRKWTQMGGAWGIGAGTFSSAQSVAALLVKCGLCVAVDGVCTCWKAVLDSDASVARLPVTLVLVDRAVNTTGPFDGPKSCGVESGVADAGAAWSAALCTQLSWV